MKSYREKLEDPRWQKIRLRVFERDGFKCVSCDGGNKPLHVHHLKYHREPWDSPLDELGTLCVDCHDNLEAAIKMLRENPQLGFLPHVVNRAIMLHESKPARAGKLLRQIIDQC